MIRLSEERFDRMENTLSQIITMLGNVMEEQTAMKTDQATMKEELTTLKDMQAAMKADQATMKSDQATMWKEITAMKKESKEQHTEVMDKLKSIEADQEHIWEKAARNEREFARFKNQFHL